MRSPLPAALALLALSGCAEVGKLAASLVVPPKLTFRTVNVSELDLEGATLAFDLELQNENGFGLEVARIAYAVEVEGAKLEGTAPGGLKLPARASAPLTLTARVRYRDIPALASTLWKKDSVPYRLSGKVGVQTPAGILELPVSHEGTLALPRLPAIGLEGISVRSLSLSHLTVALRLKLENPNPFPLPAGKLGAALTLGGAEVARVDGAALAAVGARGSAVAELPVQVDLERAGRAALDLTRGEPVAVGLRGEAEVAGVKLPLKLLEKLEAR